MFCSCTKFKFASFFTTESLGFMLLTGFKKGVFNIENIWIKTDQCLFYQCDRKCFKDCNDARFCFYSQEFYGFSKIPH